MLICRSNIGRLAILLAALSLGGCAFTEDHIDVAYTPTPQEAVTKISTPQPVPVRVQVDDQRQSKDAVGHKQNGWAWTWRRLLRTTTSLKRSRAQSNLNSIIAA